MSTKIIIDSRERLDEKIVQSVFSGMRTEVKMLIVGDYHIIIGNRLMMIIERKTLNDLAASIKDKRIDRQIADLINAAQMYENKVRVALLIEYDEYNADSTGIPLSNLEAKIDHVVWRYPEISIIKTRSQQTSMSSIFRLALNIPKDVVGILGGNPDSLIKKVLSTSELAQQFLTRIPGFGKATAELMLTKYSIMNFIEGDVDQKDISGMTLSDKRIGNTKASKLVKSFNENAVDVLTAMKGVTIKTAERITEIPFPWTAEVLAEVPIGEKQKQKLGINKSTKLLEILTYCNM